MDWEFWKLFGTVKKSTKEGKNLRPQSVHVPSYFLDVIANEPAERRREAGEVAALQSHA